VSGVRQSGKAKLTSGEASQHTCSQCSTKLLVFDICFLICSSLKILLAMRMEKRITTLREPPNLFGWDLRNVANRCEFKFMENIIKQVLQEANQTPLDVA
ncbi:hypothetical protein MTR67_025619, partial [Solanum verrucosum]